jgi:Zn-dependent metalloprotease
MNDNCGVHMNATLVGHAGYLLVNAIGPEKSGKILYSALVHYLTETSDFAAFGKAAREACVQLFGRSGSECTALEGVMVKVGL